MASFRLSLNWRICGFIFIKVSGKDAEILSAYLNVIDKLHTIENFIGIHVLNFKQIFYHFDLDRAGTARKVRGIVSDEFVLINSLTINFITSGKTLIDVIEQFDKNQPNKLVNSLVRYTIITFHIN